MRRGGLRLPPADAWPIICRWFAYSPSSGASTAPRPYLIVEPKNNGGR